MVDHHGLRAARPRFQPAVLVDAPLGAVDVLDERFGARQPVAEPAVYLGERAANVVGERVADMDVVGGIDDDLHTSVVNGLRR